MVERVRRSRYKTFAYDAYRFVFKYDDEFPEHLHIWVRHLKTAEQAIEIWFEGSQEVWNLKRKRYETYTETAGIYWIWLEQNRAIMIISCFDR